RRMPVEICQSVPIGDDEQPLTKLRDSKLVRRQVRGGQLVTSLLELAFKVQPCLPAVVPLQIRHILQQQEARLSDANNLQHMPEQIAPLRTVEALLLTRLREGLTRRSCTQDVVLGNIADRHGDNIP